MVLICLGLPLLAGYKILPLEPKPAAEYESHTDFQNVVIGADAALSLEAVLSLFDSKKVFEKGVLPVVLVVENNNDFPIRVRDRSIYLILSDGTNLQSIPFGEAFLQSVLKKDVSHYSTEERIMISDLARRHREMFEDFQHKAFGEKIIAPHDSDYGVVFFHRPSPQEREGWMLYLPEIENMTTASELMFFEFGLNRD